MTSRQRVGDLLIKLGLIDEQQLQSALKEQRESNIRIGDVLISRGYITEQQLIEVLETQLGIPHVQLYRQSIDPKVINMIPQWLIEQHQLLPLRTEGNKLLVAMADPLDLVALDELRMTTGYRIVPFIASRDELQQAIKRYYGLHESVVQIMQSLQTRDMEEEKADLAEDSPVVRTVNQIISQAIYMGASDIHIDPQEDCLRIRYRVDGVMRTERTLPPQMQSVIVARVKIMANLNVAERRLPQDGRVEMDIEYRKVDIRISTLPTIHGEKVVMRILDLSKALAEIEQLGFSEQNLNKFLKGITGAHGVVLITGPTGSGKTTTLYSALSRLNTDEVNVITVEDPVEYQLQGINQLQVNTATGLTFANGLRAILRQDPNIVMVGEIRDTETAEITVRAAMTGHLVLSTLHTNNAVNSITRLIDMGVEPYLVASAVNCVVAQRLVRKICIHCAVDDLPTDEERILLEQHGLRAAVLKKGKGCPKCGRSGYKGRLAIHEVFSADDTLRAMILQKRPDHEYMEYALKSGMTPMLQDGLNKVIAGLTTVSEVYRVVNKD